ncbi:MAG: hypothetical protein K2M48_00125, partial [Clostridiales bacterium]|nr:hypothetical protein [Clostridiales bacterium]
MKKTKKKLLLASALVSVCGCFTLVACTDDTTKPKFDAPKNVTVNVDVLSWDSVSGAAQYTVKINSDETTTVTTTSLDLTTVTAKLVEGENTLSVKVNATSEKLASAYSTSVTYTYAPSTQFNAPTVTITGDTVSWNAITGAVEYTVKINSDETTVVETTSLDLTTVTTKLVTGDNTIAVKANSVEGGKQESDYSNAVTYAYAPTPEAEAADYKKLVEAIGSITEESTATQAAAVQAAITAARNKYNGMSAEAKALEGVIADKATFDGKKDAFDGVYD